MLITRSDDGYFGLRQSLEVAFGEEVSLHFGVQRAQLDRGRSSCGTRRRLSISLTCAPYNRSTIAGWQFRAGVRGA